MESRRSGRLAAKAPVSYSVIGGKMPRSGKTPRKATPAKKSPSPAKKSPSPARKSPGSPPKASKRPAVFHRATGGKTVPKSYFDELNKHRYHSPSKKAPSRAFDRPQEEPFRAIVRSGNQEVFNFSASRLRTASRGGTALRLSKPALAFIQHLSKRLVEGITVGAMEHAAHDKRKRILTRDIERVNVTKLPHVNFTSVKVATIPE